MTAVLAYKNKSQQDVYYQVCGKFIHALLSV